MYQNGSVSRSLSLSLYRNIRHFDFRNCLYFARISNNPLCRMLNDKKYPNSLERTFSELNNNSINAHEIKSIRIHYTF